MNYYRYEYTFTIPGHHQEITGFGFVCAEDSQAAHQLVMEYYSSDAAYPGNIESGIKLILEDTNYCPSEPRLAHLVYQNLPESDECPCDDDEWLGESSEVTLNQALIKNRYRCRKCGTVREHTEVYDLQYN